MSNQPQEHARIFKDQGWKAESGSTKNPGWNWMQKRGSVTVILVHRSNLTKAV